MKRNQFLFVFGIVGTLALGTGFASAGTTGQYKRLKGEGKAAKDHCSRSGSFITFTWCSTIGTESDALEGAKQLAKDDLKEQCDDLNGEIQESSLKYATGCGDFWYIFGFNGGSGVACRATVTGKCVLKDDDRVTDQTTKAPAHVVTLEDGKQYLVDESGNAHPISAGSATE